MPGSGDQGRLNSWVTRDCSNCRESFCRLSLPRHCADSRLEHTLRFSMKEVYLHMQDLCPEGQALSDMLLVAYGLALREQRPGDTIFVPSLCLTGVSPKRGLYPCLAPHFCSCHQGTWSGSGGQWGLCSPFPWTVTNRKRTFKHLPTQGHRLPR